MKLMLCIIAVLGVTRAFENVPIFQYLVNNGYTNFTHMLVRAGLDGTLSGTDIQPLAVLAPDDHAFLYMGNFMVMSLLNNPAQLKKLLQYHMLKEFLLSYTLPEGDSKHMTLEGQNLTLHKKTDLANGTTVTVNDISIVHAHSDVICTNGVVQPIHRVLFPPVTPHLSISHVLLRDDTKYGIMVIYLMVTGLTPMLETADATVFAVTNEAFERDFHGTGQEQTTDVQRIKIMRYHVLPEKRDLASFRNNELLTTLDGHKLHVTVNAGRVMVEHATIVESDILATNGYIHAINHLLIPPGVVLTG